ncbi:MAG TPA: hypothetical protein VGN97_19975 [Mesorhizobium sp.]|nr:hypothetical protein [Mesorhizobium sp.]
MNPFVRPHAILFAALLAVAPLHVADAQEEFFCTEEYAPVCAVRGGERRTFSNACKAEIRGFRVIREGECRGRAQARQCTADRALDEAERLGFRRVEVEEVRRNRIIVSGRRRGERREVVFSREPGCPVIRIR